MHAVIPFLLRHGYWLLVANVFAEQVGLPVPAFPVLLAMGALAGIGHFSIWVAFVLAICAALASDIIWYRLGRKRGHSILNLLCRMSLEPASCVSNTKTLFGKLGARALLVSKFVPGLGAAAAPMSGLTRMPPAKFLAADVTGAALWSGTYLALGYIFRNQLELVGEKAQQMGSWLLLIIALLFSGYIGWKYYQRRRFILSLRAERVTPQELMRMLAAGEQVALVDLRHALEVEHDSVKLPGAIWITLEDLENRHEEIPRDRDIVLYCS
jgi:membrane protein DedA with SNARE-associated domain